MFEKIVSALNDIIWSPVLVVLLVGAGLYFSIRTRFVQVRRFGLMVRSLFASAEKSEDGRKQGISSFEAFCVALSGRVGTGNIVGVATAIALGGPGAIFWMWIIAFFGASTAFVESTLAQQYKFEHASGFRGGPASYIEKGLKARWLGILFSILVLIGYGTFLPTVQANGMAGALGNSFQLPPLASGLGLAFMLGLVIIGGIKSIARVASIVTPFMALGYIVITVIVIAQHIDAVPGVLGAIVTNAFGIHYRGHHVVKSLMQLSVVAAHADEHTHLAQCQRAEACIVGLAVAAEGYPDDGAFGALERVPCGVDAAGGSVVDEFNTVDACHIFKTGVGFVETDETVA